MKRQIVVDSTSKKLPGKKEQVIRLHLAGVPVMEIVARSGLSFPTVRKTINLYLSAGREAALAGRPGRPEGDGRSLTPCQERHVRDLVCAHRPDALGLCAALWNRVVLGQLIERETGCRLSPRGLDNYLVRWRMVAEPFVRKVCATCPSETRAWLTQVYPQLLNELKARGGEVYWVAAKRCCMPAIPQLPAAEKAGICEGEACHCRMLSAVSNRKLLRWMMTTGPMEPEALIGFFSRLYQDAGRSLMLVIEPADFPQLDAIADWLRAHREQINVVLLPGCRLLSPHCQDCQH